MIEIDPLASLVLLVGTLLVGNMLIRAGCGRVGVPPLVGYLLLGFLLGVLSLEWNILDEQGHTVLDFLAGVGLVGLLFRVGLESKPEELLRQLKKASGVAVGAVVVSGALAYFAASFLLGLELIPSLIVATASVATSVGLAVGIWKEADALETDDGELLIDVAEIDDVLGIVLMGLLFSILPTLRDGGEPISGLSVARTAFAFAVKLVVFGGFCILFARFAEKSITDFFSDITSEPTPMLVVAGIGFIIAAFAGALGFSLAIGAFFAGLVFSRDPRAIKIDASFESLYELFTPFFFIGIGLQIDPTTLGGVLGPAAILLIAAVLGKLLGGGGPVLLMAGWSSAVLIGLSLVPRAEIFMVIMERGLDLGEWAMPPEIFSAMVLVSAVTCFAIPLLLHPLLRRWKPTGDSDS